MGKVLITGRTFNWQGEARQLLEENGHILTSHPKDQPLTEEKLMELIADKDAIIAGLEPMTERIIASAKQLKIIARFGVGYNNIDLAAARRHNIPVTNTPGANSVSVAELAFGHMLSLARDIPQEDTSVRQGAWIRIPRNELCGKTLGIIGLGAIGGEVAKRAVAFGMRVIAHDIRLRPEFAAKYGIDYLSREEVMRQADYLSLHVPSSPETIGMINRQSLKLLKPTAYLINTARGELVVEEDLYEALKQGVIAGAALDTFAQEPLKNSLLSTLPNVVLTPHLGATTVEATNRMSLMAAQEVVRVLSGQAPLNPVQ